MFLRDVPAIFSLINDYFSSGKSIFIPSLPYINILWFLPEEYQIFQFSIGHLIDITIVWNIYCYIETGVYHYVKKVLLNEESQLFIYINLSYLGSKEKIDTESQTPAILFGIKDELKYHIDNKRGNIIERNYKLDYDFYEHLRKKRYRNNLILNKIFHRKSDFISKIRYKSMRVSCYHSVFVTFWIFHSKNHYHHPKIYNFAHSNKYFRGEEG